MRMGLCMGRVAFLGVGGCRMCRGRSSRASMGVVVWNGAVNGFACGVHTLEAERVG